MKEITHREFEQMVRQFADVLDIYMPGWESDESTENTASRFCKYLLEYATPFNPDDIFGSMFPHNGYGVVVQTNIPFRMVCEHHLLPAIGYATLGYIPNEKVIGLSKLVRLVDMIGVEKPSLQEHIGNRVVTLLHKHLKPVSTMAIFQAEHGCIACRGATKAGVQTVTEHLNRVNPDAQGPVLGRAQFIDHVKEYHVNAKRR